jgi:hypothetical protein
MYFNYRSPVLRFEKSQKKMELDVYVPSMRLAVEYQGSLSGMTLQVEKAVNLL